MDNNNQPKDTLVQIKSFNIGPSGAKSLLEPRTRYQFRIATEQANALVEAIQTALKTEDGQANGVKLDIHTGGRETLDGSRVFEAGFLFAKALQDAPGRSNTAGGRNVAVAAKQFTPVVAKK